MFHVEMRQFPHNFCRFNLGEAELRAIVDPWVREQVVDFGERRWRPHEAQLTILEGPELALGELTMGRGWRAAQRAGEDITERVLAAASVAAQAAAAQASEAAIARVAARAASTAALSDPLSVGMQLAALLGPDAARLLDAWKATAASSPALPPSQALALAEKGLDALDGKPG
jgi:hypothetical protein